MPGLQELSRIFWFGKYAGLPRTSVLPGSSGDLGGVRENNGTAMHVHARLLDVALETPGKTDRGDGARSDGRGVRKARLPPAKRGSPQPPVLAGGAIVEKASLTVEFLSFPGTGRKERKEALGASSS